MKIRIFLMSAFLLLSVVSCSKWLDVTPKDTIAEDDLFKVATGYRNALNGVYKQMSSSSLYGQELSWGMVDVLGQSYNKYSLSATNAYGIFANKYDYTKEETKAYFESVWSKAYNSIANCNNIIGRIPAEPNAKFSRGIVEKELIMGEAIALRALLHFDILRLFAPAPIAAESEKHIPYYDSYPSLGGANLSTQEVLEKVIADLKVAQTLVVKYDTMDVMRKILLGSELRFHTKTGYQNVALESDLFYSQRGYRMNYYAITAVLARVYNYAAKHDLAVIEAQKVIDALWALDEQKPLFRFNSYADVDGNRKLSDDIIFSLSDLKLYENYKKYYPSTGDKQWQLIFNDDYGSLFNDGGDCRLKLLDKIGYDVTSNKNVAPLVSNDQSTIVQDMLPVIRMSEMHLIVAENYAAKGDFIAAANAIDVVRVGRNCTKGQLKITDMKTFTNTLILEARREYFGEGQLFFYYKKYNIRPSGMSNVKSFVLPRPDSEDIN